LNISLRKVPGPQQSQRICNVGATPQKTVSNYLWYEPPQNLCMAQSRKMRMGFVEDVRSHEKRLVICFEGFKLKNEIFDEKL
jgi:hypothetical protein